MTVLLTLVLLAAVIAVVSAPLLRTRTSRGTPSKAQVGKPSEEPDMARRAELDAAREAKYREIREAELDYKTGKLSQADYDAIDATLRTEAIKILDQIEAPNAPSTEV